MKKTWEKQTVLERIEGVSKAKLRDLVEVDNITFRKWTKSSKRSTTVHSKQRLTIISIFPKFPDKKVPNFWETHITSLNSRVPFPMHILCSIPILWKTQVYIVRKYCINR